MARKFSKKIVRKKTYKLSPKEAETIFEQEITTSRGDKIINKIRFKPQNPLKPDFTQTIRYKDKENSGNN